ncbi:MAG: hypothetical protein ABJA84_00135 [Polaromonas sp.]
MKIPQIPLTNAQRVEKCKAELVARGGKRMPTAMLQPHEAQALADLVASGYASSPAAVFRAALLDAHKKIKRANR